MLSPFSWVLAFTFDKTMKVWMNLLILLPLGILFAQNPKPKKYRIEAIFQKHYSYRKYFFKDTKLDGNDQFYVSPEVRNKREEEESPCFSQSIGININYTHGKWITGHIGVSTGTKGYNSMTQNEYNIYTGKTTIKSDFKPFPYYGINYSVGPNLNLFNSNFSAHLTMGHSFNLMILKNEDSRKKFQYNGLYSVRSKKGFLIRDVESPNGTVQPFYTLLNFGINYSVNHFSLGFNGTYEFNLIRRRYDLGKGVYSENSKIRPYIYSLGIQIGYCW